MTEKEAIAREIEWTERITDAVSEQTWGTAIRKMANLAIIIAVIAIITISYAAVAISPLAGCVTACVIFLSLAVATEILARITNHKNAVLDAAKTMTNSLKPPAP